MQVLLVDDSRAMRDYVSSILETTGEHDVVEAANGFDALRELPRQSFELIITDVNMPDVSGIELTRFVRKSPKHAQIPLIVISTEGALVDVERAMKAGANAFVVKPFTAERLLEVVRDVTERGVGGAR